jgi:hypothetical protein
MAPCRRLPSPRKAAAGGPAYPRCSSRILDAVHETARDLHAAGFVSKRRMKDYDALCLVSERVVLGAN